MSELPPFYDSVRYIPHRSNEEKRKYVLEFLQSDEAATLSNREIARRCGVDEKTVRNCKNESNLVQKSKKSRFYGERISFRGLTYAPVNEQGVVFLFGMIAKDLDYIVESVQVGFPDCLAKRRSHSNPERWEEVRIEFEFNSRAFVEHGHAADECDLIVCWQDDWVPARNIIEVLELRSILSTLDENA